MNSKTRILLFTTATLPCSLSAATILNTSETQIVGTTSYNLTTLGTSDWAVWSTSANPSTGAAAQQKAAATIISTTLVPIGNAALRGSGSGTVAGFSWTDGSPTTSASVTNASGVFNTQLDTEGNGVQLTITLPTTDTYRIRVWTGVFAGTGTFTASLPGATSYVDITTTGTGTPKPAYLQTFDVTPDSPGAVLTISNVLTTENTSMASSHVGIIGAAVSVIPEPSSLALLSLGALLAFRRKR